MPIEYKSLEDYNELPIRKPVGKVWFLNGDLVRVYHRTRSEGIITLYNINRECLQTILLDEWTKKRKRAYSVKATADLLNRHRKYIPQMVKRGIIPPPTGACPDRQTKWGVRGYYSEDDVRDIRDILASRSIGRPRRDKLITNNHTPTPQELTRRLGDGILHYTRTEDGRIVPIWDETI